MVEAIKVQMRSHNDRITAIERGAFDGTVFTGSHGSGHDATVNLV